MVFGGTLAMAVEHVYHGEIVPWPPFLTAMATPESTAVMFNEMVTVGIPMTIAIALAWLAIVFVQEKIIAPRGVEQPFGQLQLGFLGLMLLGALSMLAVDIGIAYLESGETWLSEPAAPLLLAAMLAPLMLAWATRLLADNQVASA